MTATRARARRKARRRAGLRAFLAWAAREGSSGLLRDFTREHPEWKTLRTRIRYMRTEVIPLFTVRFEEVAP